MASSSTAPPPEDDPMVAAAVEEMNLWHAGVVFTCAHFRAGVVIEGNSDAFETAKHDFIQHVKNAQCDVAQVIATHCPPGSSWDSAPGWAKQRPADHRFWCAVEEEYNSPASMHMRNEEIPAFKEMLESVRNYMVQKFILDKVYWQVLVKSYTVMTRLSLMAATMLSTDAGIMQSLMRTLVQKGVPKNAIVNAVGKMKKLPPWMDPDMQDRMLTTRDDSLMRKLNVAWRVQNAFGNRMFNKFPLRPPTLGDIKEGYTLPDTAPGKKIPMHQFFTLKTRGPGMSRAELGELREQIAAQQEAWEETPATPYVRQQMSGYGAEKYADWEPVDRHASNALQLAQDTYYMKLPKSSSTVSVEDARGSDEAIWNSYDEAYRRANELALPYQKTMQQFGEDVKLMQPFMELENPLVDYARAIYTRQQEVMEDMILDTRNVFRPMSRERLYEIRLGAEPSLRELKIDTDVVRSVRLHKCDVLCKLSCKWSTAAGHTCNAECAAHCNDAGTEEPQERDETPREAAQRHEPWGCCNACKTDNSGPDRTVAAVARVFGRPGLAPVPQDLSCPGKGRCQRHQGLV